MWVERCPGVRASWTPRVTLKIPCDTGKMQRKEKPTRCKQGAGKVRPSVPSWDGTNSKCLLNFLFLKKISQGGRIICHPRKPHGMKVSLEHSCAHICTCHPCTAVLPQESGGGEVDTRGGPQRPFPEILGNSQLVQLWRESLLRKGAFEVGSPAGG